jgi:nitroreductase
MNEMVQKILTRHAIRRFQDKQITEEELEQILQAGLYAPSAGNNQYSRIVVSQNKELNEKLGKLSRYMLYKGKDPNTSTQSISTDQPSILDDLTILNGFYNAPTVLTIFTKKTKYAYEDAAMIGENIMLAAHFLNIGSCYIGRTDEVFATDYGMELRKEWGVPDDMVAVCNVLLGYVDGAAPHDKPRKEGRIIRV